jgi:hypothetical protein
MFEKEAEEYARQNNPAEYGVRATHFTVLNSFKDGAEFGYNKANEWHDLRKNSNDLPEKLETSPVSRTVVNQIGTPCHYHYNLQCWQNWDFITIETPIAWCEIPKFKEIE